MATTYKTSAVNVTQVGIPAVIQHQEPHPAERYKNVFMGLGIAQLIIGILCLILGIVLFVFLSIFYIGTGVWGGVWYIITGSLGISISRSPNYCNTIAGLVISIIASIVALVHGILDALAAVGWSRLFLSGVSRSFIVGLYGTVSFLALVQLVLAIIHASFCGIVACGPRTPQVLGTTTVMTVPASQQGYAQQHYHVQPAGGATVYTNVPVQQQMQPPMYTAPVPQNQ